MLYPNKIEKSTISTLPPCDITGEIIIIDRPEDVAAAVDDLKQCSLIGFDTETRPSFRRGESNTISLLQLATDRRAYLFRLKKIGPNQLLKDLLGNTRAVNAVVLLACNILFLFTVRERDHNRRDTYVAISIGGQNRKFDRSAVISVICLVNG